METTSSDKEYVFNLIDNFSADNDKLIDDVQKSLRIIGHQKNLPNIGITLNNKLIDFMHEFQDANLAMFPDEIGNDKNSNNMSFSVLGSSIVISIFNKARQSVDLLTEYKIIFTEIANQKLRPLNQHRIWTSIKKFIFTCINYFVPDDSPKSLFRFNKDEIDRLYAPLTLYQEADNNIWNSKLKDYIIPSTIEYITDTLTPKSEIEELLEACIIPELKKLKLEGMIPELKEEVAKFFGLKDSSRRVSWDLPADFNLDNPVILPTKKAPTIETTDKER